MLCQCPKCARELDFGTRPPGLGQAVRRVRRCLCGTTLALNEITLRVDVIDSDEA